MIRSSNLYRRMWYIKKRKVKQFQILSVLISITIILTPLLTYAEKKILPYLTDICDYRVKSMITIVVNEAISEDFTDDIRYEDLVTISKDSEGHITSVQTNTVRLNKVSAKIATTIQEKLLSMNHTDIAIPSGVLFNHPILQNLGPDIHVKVIPEGSVEANIKSEFMSAGINQTRHRLVLEVKTKVGIIIPMIKKQSEFTTDIPIAETIIVGE